MILYPCHGQAGNQAWEYQEYEGSEMLMQGDKCLTLGNDDGRVKLTMERCEEGNGMQRWPAGRAHRAWGGGLGDPVRR